MYKFEVKKLTIAFALFLTLIFAFVTANRCFTGENAAAMDAAATKSSYGISEIDRNTFPSVTERVDTSSLFGDYLITEGGEYILTGKLNGRIVINAEGQMVHLFLENLEIESYNGPAVFVEEAGKIVITALPGTENNISDSVYAEDSSNGACVFSESDITFNGEGKISIHGNYEDGIFGRDIVKFYNTNVCVYAMKDGITANDGIFLKEGYTEVQAKKNGLLTLKKGKDNRGTIESDSTTLSVVAGSYALKSSSDILIKGNDGMLKGIVGNTYADGNCYIE